MSTLRTNICAALVVLAAVATIADVAVAENVVVTSVVEPVSARSGATVELRVKFELASGIHLYKKKLSFDWDETNGVIVGDPQLPTAGTVPDPLDETGFGVIEVYDDSVTVAIPLEVTAEPGSTATVTGTVHYQGCTDTMCFVPMQHRLSHEIEVVGAATAQPAAAPTSVEPPPAERADVARSETAPMHPPGPGQGFLLRVLMAFGVGLLMSLTPCVYPLIPITVAIVGGGQQVGERNVPTALLRSVVYVLGLALVYATLGVLSATLGGAFSRWLKTAWVLVPVAALFVLLGLSMFDLFTVQTPSFITNRVSAGRGGRRVGDVFVLGLAAGIVATPCIAAPLAGILTFIATTGNRLLGFCMLFALAWGMGLLLIVVGTTAGSFLPKAGNWMVWVKKLLGFVMFWAAAYFLMPVIGVTAYHVSSAIVIIVAVVFLGGLDTLSPSSKFPARLKRAVGTVALILAVLLLVRSLGTAPPDRAEQTTASTLYPADAATFERALASGRPTMVELYADWCTVCKKLERTTLSSPAVADRLAEVNALKLNYDHNTKLLSKYDILGVPTIMFFDADGSEIRDLRLAGFIETDKVVAAIDTMLAGTR